MDQFTVSDILYPECHLNSPIVTGKLVNLLTLAGLPHKQTLNDETLLKNLNHNLKTHMRSQLTVQQLSYHQKLRAKYPNLEKLRPIPYPEGNYYLFRICSHQISEDIRNTLTYAHTCYRKISDKLYKLVVHVEKRLGEYPSHTTEPYIHRERCIRDLPYILEGSKWYRPFMFWFTIKKEMRSIIKTSTGPLGRGLLPMYVHDGHGLYIQINRNLLTIINKDDLDTHYLTFEMVLMMCDVLEGRLMIDLAMTVDLRFQQFRERGHMLWELIDSLFIDLGNNTYNIVAMIEPLVLGYLQLRDESRLLRGAFLDFCLHELQDELINNGFDHEDDIDKVIDSIHNIFMIEDLHMTAEFFSFFRTFGHPTLEACEAACKVREHMNKPKIVRFETMMKGHALFCGTIINGFRDRHGGAWPPVVFPEHVDKQIKQQFLNSEGLTDEACILNWKSFVGFKFKCFMPLTLDEDLTMYMKDKALAAISSEWDSVYPRETLRYQPPRQTTSRRLVEVFLNDNEFDPVNLINYVLSGEYLRDKEFNLSYSLKEKEIKRVGRLFAKMTYKMRACQVVAEALIATGVGKYFKENGMVKDEHELLKTLHKLSVSSIPRDNKQGYKAEQFVNSKTSKAYQKLKDEVQFETVSTFLTTDLQKFCLNWRQETTNIFAQRLNEIYGLPGFFNWLHKRLERSILYVADPSCPPDIDNHTDLSEVDNKQLFIKYPMGGIEGYCQKLWTIITIPFLFLSAYEVGAKIAAVVQGDNQAIAITRRVHPNLPFTVKKFMSSQLAQQYFRQLRKNMHDIGHNLKANETIVSSHFFVYSKRIYYDGLVLSQALKPISRAVFWSETIVDETRSACSNISTAISKSIEQGFSKWMGYCINILKTLEQLAISIRFTINPAMTPDISDPILSNPYWLISAALIPSQLGGFNYMNMCRLYVRNIGDPVTASIADIKRMIDIELITPRTLQKIMHQSPGDCTYLDWASDPYSLNIPHIQSISMMLKNITARVILQHSENPMLKGLFHFDFEQEDRDLAEFLLDRPVILPRAAHEIMDKSLTGARQEIAGMLDSTKGLIRNSLKSGGLRPRLMERLSLYDYEQIRTFNQLMRCKKENPLITHNACSVELAITLRKRMWHGLTHGRPIYGLEVPDILEAMMGYIVKDCEDCYYCQAQNKEFCWFFTPKHCQLDSVHNETNALRVPYFGSTTDERSEIKLSTVRSASRALKAAIRIATVYTWAYGDSDESWEEAWYLASFRAKLTIDELKAVTPISTSNNIAHRLRDKSTQMKYSGTTLNRASRYTVISNDNLNFVRDDRKIDTNLVYQQVMLLGLSVLETRFRFCSDTGETNTVLHLHVTSDCCVVEMNDHPYIPSSKPLPNLNKVECNRLIYDSDPIFEKEVEHIHMQLFNLPTLDFPRWTLNQLNTGLAQSLALTIIEIITKEDKDHLNEFKVLSNDDDINSLITEFLLVDPAELTLYLGLSIAVNWSFNIYYRRPEGKYQMVEYLYTILTQSPKSYFGVLANVLSHPGVFSRFWDGGFIEPVYGPNLSSQDYTRVAIDYLILCYQTYLNYWSCGQNLDYMITESSEDVVDQRYEIVQSKHLCCLTNLYLLRSDMPIIRGMTSLEKCKILLTNLIDHRSQIPSNSGWNLQNLNVVVYPASLTYIRRGCIKHIKLRNSLTSTTQKLHNNDKKVGPVRDHNIYKYEDGGGKPIVTSIKDLFSDDLRDTEEHTGLLDTKNRWECHVNRRIGINSTSCYKALEIGYYLKERIDSNSPRLFIGEGSGSMLTVYYHLFGPALTYYNTGVFNTDAIGQRVLNVSPAEAHLVMRNNIDDTQFDRHIKVLFNGKPESTWIGNMSAFAYIMSTIDPHSLSFIHSDMESSFDKGSSTILCEQIHALCLAINLGKDNHCYACKLAPMPGDEIDRFLKLTTIFYNCIECFCPSYSNPHSSEFYLIMSECKISTMIYPESAMKILSKIDRNNLVDLNTRIRNMKLMEYFKRKDHFKQYGDYSNSNLCGLTSADKILLQMGFQMNGPKLIKQMVGHDIGSGSGSLRASIQLLVNNLINYLDPERESVQFFDAYPIRYDSKIREMIDSIAMKIIIYHLVYTYPKNNRLRSNYINNIRNRILCHDFLHKDANKMIPKNMIKKLKTSKLNLNWFYNLNSATAKVWWKIVGYSLLITESQQ